MCPCVSHLTQFKRINVTQIWSLKRFPHNSVYVNRGHVRTSLPRNESSDVYLHLHRSGIRHEVRCYAVKYFVVSFFLHFTILQTKIQSNWEPRPYLNSVKDGQSSVGHEVGFQCILICGGTLCMLWRRYATPIFVLYYICDATLQRVVREIKKMMRKKA